MNGDLHSIFEINIENETGYNYVVFKFKNPEGVPIYNYQIEMISNNPVPYIISPEIRRKDSDVSFYFNITSKIPFPELMKTLKPGDQSHTNILSKVLKALIDSRSLFLYEENFILDEELIYIDPELKIPAMLYLPTNINIDYDWKLRDFITRLLTRTDFAYMKIWQNNLYKLMELIKARNINIEDIYKILASAPNASENAVNQQEEEIPPEQKAAQARKNKKNEKIHDVKTAIVISQLCVSTTAILVNLSMKSIIYESSLRYAIVFFAVFIADLILLRHIHKAYSLKPPLNDLEQRPPLKALDRKPPLNGLERKPPEMLITEEPVHINSSKLIKSEKNAVSDATTLLCDFRQKRAWLISGKGEEIVRYELSAERVFIGRNSAAADIIIDEKSVGRLHAEIINKEGAWYITDKNSKNGTYINGEKLQGGCESELKNGCTLTFANMEYRFVLK